MYVRPSTSFIVAPCALAMKRGVPPTPRNARTGEFTPPGINSTARAKSSSELCCLFAELLCASLLIFDLRTAHDNAAADHAPTRRGTKKPTNEEKRPNIHLTLFFS